MYICLDIGGTSIKAAISDINCNLSDKCKLPISQDFNELVDIITSYINKKKEIYDIKGVAISFPGAVDSESGIIYGASAIPCIHGPNWKKVLGEKVNLNISIENDANCAALAEIFSGKAKGLKDVLFVVCGTGIGGSIVKDGRIHRGNNLHGGEFGYMIMDEIDGEFINYSKYASTMSFVRKVRSYYDDESWNGEKIFEAASNGDKTCIEAIDTFYKNFARGIFNLQYIYDPELILIGGAISEREDFIDNINEKINYLLRKNEEARIRPLISECYYRNDANLIGALVNYLNEYGS